MPRFFVPSSALGLRDDGGQTVLIEGSDAAHITRSLRLRPGEHVCVCDTAGREYDCVVVSTGERVLLSVESESISSVEPPYRATVYQALLKGDKFDTVVQKSVECGAARIVPVLCERCVSRPDAKSAAKKAERWQRIAHEAAKQCGRAVIPEVSIPTDFHSAVAEAAKADISLFCYECEKKVSLRRALRDTAPSSSVSLFIGCEGGFSAIEAERAAELSLTPVTLGKRILRAETAASFALACLNYEFEL